MLIEIGTALGIAIVASVIVGTVVRGILNLRSAVNWLVQTAVLVAVAGFTAFSTPVTVAMVSFPTGIHLLNFLLKRRQEKKVKRGEYGESAKWAHELFDAEDMAFIKAQTALPKTDVMEVSIIADSKDELREAMIERYKENLSEELSGTETNY